MYRKAVFIVTYLKNKNKVDYLLLKRKLHWKGWEFPKGGIESRESNMSAVKRELKEETGQSGKIKKFNISGKYNYDKDTCRERNFKGQKFKLFSAEIKSKKIKIDRKEHSAFKFVSFQQAEKLLTWQNQKKCLKLVNSKLS